jgi:transposase
MLNWSHFTFRQSLRHKAKEFGAAIHKVSQHYSSKGCGQCGKIHRKLGGAKALHCPYRHFNIDRDFDGVRNIFLMNLDHHFLLNPLKEAQMGANTPVTIQVFVQRFLVLADILIKFWTTKSNKIKNLILVNVRSYV